MWKHLKDHGSGKEAKQILDPAVNLNDLNEFFCGVDNETNDDLIEYYKRQKSVDGSEFVFCTTNEEEILNVLKTISSNAVGNDCIPIKFIR